MEMSETIGKLTAALIKAKREFKPILKNKSISFGSGKPIAYADLDCMREATENALGNHGLCIYQNVEPTDDYVIIVTILAHESGEFMRSTTKMPTAKAARNASQECGSVITYARRYSYMGILCISPCDDLDGSLIEDAPRATSASTPRTSAAAVPQVKSNQLTYATVAMLLKEKKICNDDLNELKRHVGIENVRDIPAEKLEYLRQFIKE